MGESAPPSDNIYVGNIPAQLSDQELTAIFSQYGTVKSVRTLPPKAGGPVGSALIRFTSVEEATWVVQNLNGNLPEGLPEPIQARFANPPGSRAAMEQQGCWGSKGLGGKGGKGGKDFGDPSANIFIGELPVDITKEHVSTIFSQYGTVKSCTVLPPKQPGYKAAAIMSMGSAEEAKWVVENLNGNLAEGLSSPVTVKFKTGGGGGKGGDKGGGGGSGGDWQSDVMAGLMALANGDWQGAKGALAGALAGPAGRSSPYGKGKGKGDNGKGNNAKGVVAAVRKSGLVGPMQDVPLDCQVYIKGLPPDSTDLDLYKLFSPFGAIATSGCKAMMNLDGSCKGVGFVDYADATYAQAAIAAMNGFPMPDGSVLIVSAKVVGKGKSDKGAGKGW